MKYAYNLLAAASLTACTTAPTTRTSNPYVTQHDLAQYNGEVTPYLPMPRDMSALRGGYTTTEISPGVYAVGFTGNGATPMTVIEDSAKYRAAEVALRNGYRYFAILHRIDGPVAPTGGHYVVYSIACHNEYLSNDLIDAAQLMSVIGAAYKSS